MLHIYLILLYILVAPLDLHPIEISRRGKPVALLVSLEGYEHAEGGWRRRPDVWEAIEGWRARWKPEEWAEGEDPWAGVRDRSTDGGRPPVDFSG